MTCSSRSYGFSRLLVSLAGVCCLWLLLPGLVLEASQTLASLTPLQKALDHLYSARFSLSSRGTPSVTVGVAQGIRQARLTLRGNGQLLWYKPDGSLQKQFVSSSKEWSVALAQGTPASVRFWLSPFTIPYTQRSAIRKQRQFWKTRGEKLRLWTVGSVFSVQGRWVDNRRLVGILRSYSSRRQARRVATRLSENQPMPLQVHEQLVRRASGQLRIRGEGKSWLSSSLAVFEPLQTSTSIRLDWSDAKGRFHSRSYKGTLLFAVGKSGRMVVINRIALPSYLKGVLPSEMPARAPLEALKAQAVCARNEVMAKIGSRHMADPFLFCAHTHCQVYHGDSAAHSRTNKAIRATRGMIMWHSHGRIADAYYSAVSGGHTENNENVWFSPGDPMLRGKPDLMTPNATYSKGITSKNISTWLRSPPQTYSSRLGRRFRWIRTFSPSRLRRLVERKYAGVGTIRKLVPLKRGVSGRIYKLRIVGSQKSVIVYGELRIRRLLGNLRSSMFLVDASPASGSPVWKLLGGGWGHGVGMCQWGAIERARKGQSFRTILHHYYSSMKLLKLY